MIIGLRMISERLTLNTSIYKLQRSVAMLTVPQMCEMLRDFTMFQEKAKFYNYLH